MCNGLLLLLILHMIIFILKNKFIIFNSILRAFKNNYSKKYYLKQIPLLIICYVCKNVPRKDIKNLYLFY